MRVFSLCYIRNFRTLYDASYANRTLYLEVGPSVVPVFPVYTSECKLYYPITPAYAFTVNKMQGETLDHVTLVFDKEFAGPGIGYVAISRVRELKNVVPLLSCLQDHFQPIRL